jgi:hypothetical protein
MRTESIRRYGHVEAVDANHDEAVADVPWLRVEHVLLPLSARRRSEQTQ